jgi:mRNA interferase MazF
MPTFRQGQVVRVPFPYTDRSTRQHRPALIVSDGAIGENGGFLWVVMITSAENRPWPGDHPIARFAAAGLPIASVVRPAKITTVEAKDAEPVGEIEPKLMTAIVSTIDGFLGHEARPQPNSST